MVLVNLFAFACLNLEIRGVIQIGICSSLVVLVVKCNPLDGEFFFFNPYELSFDKCVEINIKGNYHCSRGR